jgi:hypothetical protein
MTLLTETISRNPWTIRGILTVFTSGLLNPAGLLLLRRDIGLGQQTITSFRLATTGFLILRRK